MRRAHLKELTYQEEGDGHFILFNIEGQGGGRLGN